jgi:hypothetical protein
MENSDGVHSHLFQRLRPWQKAASLKKKREDPRNQQHMALSENCWYPLKFAGQSSFFQIKCPLIEGKSPFSQGKKHPFFFPSDLHT